MAELVMEKEVLFSPLKDVEDWKDVHVILLKVLSKAIQTKDKPYSIKMCGKSMMEWVKSACSNCPITEVEYSDEDDLMILLKSLAKREYRYTVVLYSDTPLLQKSTFKDVIDFVRLKNLTVAKLTRGYVFETEYLLTINRLLSPQTYYFEEEDFMCCFNLKQVALVGDILKNRILSYHMKNGVLIKDIATTFIDADVLIGENVVIEPFNQVLGNTKLGNDVVLKSGNTLENAIILGGAQIEKSVIKNSVIGENSIVEPFCRVENRCIIGSNCTIKSFNNLTNGKKIENGMEI